MQITWVWKNYSVQYLPFIDIMLYLSDSIKVSLEQWILMDTVKVMPKLDEFETIRTIPLRALQGEDI